MKILQLNLVIKLFPRIPSAFILMLAAWNLNSGKSSRDILTIPEVMVEVWVLEIPTIDTMLDLSKAIEPILPSLITEIPASVSIKSVMGVSLIRKVQWYKVINFQVARHLMRRVQMIQCDFFFQGFGFVF